MGTHTHTSTKGHRTSLLCSGHSAPFPAPLELPGYGYKIVLRQIKATGPWVCKPNHSDMTAAAISLLTAMFQNQICEVNELKLLNTFNICTNLYNYSTGCYDWSEINTLCSQHTRNWMEVLQKLTTFQQSKEEEMVAETQQEGTGGNTRVLSSRLVCVVNLVM